MALLRLEALLTGTQGSQLPATDRGREGGRQSAQNSPVRNRISTLNTVGQTESVLVSQICRSPSHSREREREGKRQMQTPNTCDRPQSALEAVEQRLRKVRFHSVTQSPSFTQSSSGQPIPSPLAPDLAPSPACAPVPANPTAASFDPRAARNIFSRRSIDGPDNLNASLSTLHIQGMHTGDEKGRISARFAGRLPFALPSSNNTRDHSPRHHGLPLP
jgi:hypothetical protein